MTVLGDDVSEGPLRVHVETAGPRPACLDCAGTLRVKDRPVVELVDLPCFGRPTRLAWRKVRRACPNEACLVTTFTEDVPTIAAARLVMTDRADRRVQNETLGHRGHADDPLYRSRWLLTCAAERHTEKGPTKLLGLLDAGDPKGEDRMAWHAKEMVRGLYDHHDPDLALEFVGALGHDLQDDSCPPETRKLGRTIVR